MLELFFAITISGALYKVSLEDGKPVVEKLEQKWAATASQVGVGSKLHDRNFLAITFAHGLVLYNSPLEKERPLDVYDPRTEVGSLSTSPIVALFLLEEEARECLFSGKSLGRLDRSWHSNTEMVANAIGVNHTRFILGRYFLNLIKE
ncbi:MAG: hypothetical protein WCO23_03175 [bacterium]